MDSCPVIPVGSWLPTCHRGRVVGDSYCRGSNCRALCRELCAPLFIIARTGNIGTGRYPVSGLGTLLPPTSRSAMCMQIIVLSGPQLPHLCNGQIALGRETVN